MSHTTQTPTTTEEVFTDKANALHLQLHNLTEIVKLLAFAAEARRTLSAIESTTNYRPDMQEVILDSVPNPTYWSEMEDNAGGVLVYVARQLEKVNEDSAKNFYGLANTLKGANESEKNGGAA